MARTIGTNFQAQLDSSQLQPFYAVSLGFSPTKLNVWTGYNDLFIDSETYVGSGNLLSISQIEESAEIRATGIKISLSGIPSSLLSEILTEDAQGTVAEVFFGVLQTSDNQTVIVDTPYKLFGGFIDIMTIIENGNESIVSVSVENALITLEKAKDRRYTDQDQKNLFSGDKGLEFVDDLQDQSIAWGGGTR